MTKQKVIDRAKELLGEGKIRGFIALRERNGHVQPHVFTTVEELTALNLGDRKHPGDARYPLNKLLVELSRLYPEDTFAVLVRGCDERGIVELVKWHQVNPERLVTVGIPCAQELAAACACSKPYPDQCVDGEKAQPASRSPLLEGVEGKPLEERFQFWMEHFARCVKCYGCRNICPMCFCQECSLEEAELIQKGVLPTENPIFHLTRAVHMIGRCIDCGLCEEACPADIPIRALYKKVAEIVAAETGYRPGENPDEKCPYNVYGVS